MKRVGCLALLLWGLPAWAAWVTVAEDGTATTYGDPATVERKGDTATLWTIVDFRQPKRLVELAYRSQKQHVEYRCTTTESRVLGVSLHTEAMGGGKVAYEDASPKDWVAVEPDSPSGKLREMACR